MNTTVQALQNLYVAKGGNLTDTYDNIASGAPVSDYVVIPDVIMALAMLEGGEGFEPVVGTAVVGSTNI